MTDDTPRRQKEDDDERLLARVDAMDGERRIRTAATGKGLAETPVRINAT